MKTETRVCIKCGVILTAPENWYPFDKAHSCYICKQCKRNYGSAYKQQRYKTDEEYRYKRKQASLIWYRNHKEYYKQYFKNRYQTDINYREKQLQTWRKNSKRYKQTRYKTQTCNIIKEHAEILKDDPERLSTEFIKSIINLDSNECK